MLLKAWNFLEFVTLSTHFVTYITIAIAALGIVETNNTKTQSNSTFQWPLYDSRFHCIVGIAVDGKPVGIGTLIYEDLIVTSANPLEPYLTRNEKSNKITDYIDENKKIKVYAIDGKADVNKSLAIVNYTANVSNRDKEWIRLGFDEKQSTIHDLIFITIKKGQVKKPPVNDNKAFYINASEVSNFYSGWTFAGFGYENKDHIAHSTELKITFYEDSDEVDCDEWIPRSWGRFVCLFNSENLTGVQSGAPLFQSGTLRGIGCFHLRKGEESILVFTDFSPYRELLDDEEPTTTNPSETTTTQETSTTQET